MDGWRNERTQGEIEEEGRQRVMSEADGKPERERGRRGGEKQKQLCQENVDHRSNKDRERHQISPITNFLLCFSEVQNLQHHYHSS